MKIDNEIVKRAHKLTSYSPENLEELRRCLDPGSGPEYFMENYVYVQNVSKGKVLFKLYEYQKGLVDTYHNYRYSVSLVSRQMGKCLSIDSKIKIRNKNTGEIVEMAIGEFFDLHSSTTE